MHLARRSLLACAAVLVLGLLAAAGSAQAFTFESSFGSPGSGDGQFIFVSQIALDSGGNVYAAAHSAS